MQGCIKLLHIFDSVFLVILICANMHVSNLSNCINRFPFILNKFETITLWALSTPKSNCVWSDYNICGFFKKIVLLRIYNQGTEEAKIITGIDPNPNHTIFFCCRGRWKGISGKKKKNVNSFWGVSVCENLGGQFNKNKFISCIFQLQC